MRTSGEGKIWKFRHMRTTDKGVKNGQKFADAFMDGPLTFNSPVRAVQVAKPVYPWATTSLPRRASVVCQVYHLLDIGCGAGGTSSLKSLTDEVAEQVYAAVARAPSSIAGRRALHSREVHIKNVFAQIIRSQWSLVALVPQKTPEKISSQNSIVWPRLLATPFFLAFLYRGNCEKWLFRH